MRGCTVLRLFAALFEAIRAAQHGTHRPYEEPTAEPDDSYEGTEEAGSDTPAGAPRLSESYGFRTFEWCGTTWAVREKNDRVGFTGPQASHPDHGEGLWVDGATVLPDGRLELRSQGINGAVEIIAEESTGYGTYEFTYTADFDGHHPSTVFGLFPYDWAGEEQAAGFSEIDFIEISRWGNPERGLPRGAVTYYSDETGDGTTLRKFDVPSGPQTLTTVAEWRPDYIRVTTTTADGTVLSEDVATVGVPRDRAQQVHINLWTYSDRGVESRRWLESSGDVVVLDSFRFRPEVKHRAD